MQQETVFNPVFSSGSKKVLYSEIKKSGKEKTAVAYQAVKEDSVLLPSFTIQLQLSARAEEQLRKTKETVIVNASFSGIPKDKSNKQYQQSGCLVLANKDKELATTHTAVFNDVWVYRKDYDGLGSKDVEVLINVYSGRRSLPNNILHGGFLQEPISIVKKQTNILKVQLIVEQ